MGHKKTRVEIAPGHPWCEMVNRPRSCGPSGNGLQNPLVIQARLLTEGHGFRQTKHAASNQDLIDEFGPLSSPWVAVVDDGLPQVFEDGLGGSEGRLRPSDHDRESSFAGPHITARDRGIQGHGTLGGGLLGQTFGHPR